MNTFSNNFDGMYPDPNLNAFHFGRFDDREFGMAVAGSRDTEHAETTSHSLHDDHQSHLALWDDASGFDANQSLDV